MRLALATPGSRVLVAISSETTGRSLAAALRVQSRARRVDVRDPSADDLLHPVDGVLFACVSTTGRVTGRLVDRLVNEVPAQAVVLFADTPEPLDVTVRESGRPVFVAWSVNTGHQLARELVRLLTNGSGVWDGGWTPAGLVHAVRAGIEVRTRQQAGGGSLFLAPNVGQRSAGLEFAMAVERTADLGTAVEHLAALRRGERTLLVAVLGNGEVVVADAHDDEPVARATGLGVRTVEVADEELLLVGDELWWRWNLTDEPERMSGRFVPRFHQEERFDAGSSTVTASGERPIVRFHGVDERRITAEGGRTDLVASAGDLLISGGGTAALTLWDVPTGDLVQRLAGHETGLVALDVLVREGGTEWWFVSASRGGSVCVWDPESGALVKRVNGRTPTSALTCFTGADGRPRVATAGSTGVVRVWDPGLVAVSRTGSVTTRGFGDRVATADLLGRGAYTAALVDALRAAPHDDDSGPTVISVEGAWGSGKSSLLEFVKRGLVPAPLTPVREPRFTVRQAHRALRAGRSGPPPEQREPEDAGPAPVTSLVATFNPWQHQSSEQVWAGLARTLVHTVETALFADRNARDRYWFTRNAARIDHERTTRELIKRIRSPFLAVAALGLGLSVLGQLTRVPLHPAWLIGIATAPLAAGLVHTAWRYLAVRASVFLPGELFSGPVRSRSFATGGSGADPVVRDPYYNARSGYLYLVQHDVAEILRDLRRRHVELVVVVDDLDRCTPKTTAEVFEAINVFLSGELPRTRFVLGLDPVVVASHVDHAYRELADAGVVAHPDDPSPGWTFLRKLVQLPVRLPATGPDDVNRVLTAQLGPVHDDAGPLTTPAPEPRPGTASGTAQAPPEAVPAVETVPSPTPPAPELVTAAVVAIERHPRVREHLHRRLAAQSEHSVREEKRLVTLWQFYLRVLAVRDEDALVEQGCHLVALAEIVTRWPAYQQRLHARYDGERGLAVLVGAVGDDVAWSRALAKLGLTRADERAAANLRALLLDCDAHAVALLADRLL
ncbi:P-loop NTPase fold protein [Umezawaea beigongshangensis]|uniref:P-loop NTPase fold protein n=1 Tax=Umezawaea beigongshangensis TaxID=2780383 RepID=UPI0018F21EC1|nr:P-loop NTPase fold protein [Umezawaea beigongshangensis]